jgi:hypothetical protein
LALLIDPKTTNAHMIRGNGRAERGDVGTGGWSVGEAKGDANAQSGEAMELERLEEIDARNSSGGVIEITVKHARHLPKVKF